MTVDELLGLFRRDVSDTVAPYLWDDVELLSYANDAVLTFVRLTGGIPDSTTPAVTQIPILAGVSTAKVSPLILNFRSAYLVSNGRKLEIINGAEVPLNNPTGFNGIGNPVNDRPGDVRFIEIGVERGLGRWVSKPLVNDTCQLSVFRLPINQLIAGGQITEIGTEHHRALMLHMKYLAYAKHDGETFQQARSEQQRQLFEQYCQRATDEWDRYKTKVRIVAYGGL